MKYKIKKFLSEVYILIKSIFTIWRGNENRRHSTKVTLEKYKKLFSQVRVEDDVLSSIGSQQQLKNLRQQSNKINDNALSVDCAELTHLYLCK